MEFLNSIKDRLPEHAKDIRLNLDSVIARSSLASEDADCGGAGRRLRGRQPAARCGLQGGRAAGRRLRRTHRGGAEWG